MGADGADGAAGDFRRIAHRYFRAAGVYLSLGAVLGALMIWFGNDNFQFLHGHMLLIGALLFGAYGAGSLWIAGKIGAPSPGASAAASAAALPSALSSASSGSPSSSPPGPSASMASAQFWLANIGLPGMLLGSVLPVGYGLDRIAILFGFLEAAAALLFAVTMKRALRRTGTTTKRGRS